MTDTDRAAVEAAVERVSATVAHLKETIARYGTSAALYSVTLNLTHNPSPEPGQLSLDDLDGVLAELERLGRVEQERDAANRRPACPECGRTDVPLTGAGQLEYHFDERAEVTVRCKGIGAPAAIGDLAARDEREAGR